MLNNFSYSLRTLGDPIVFNFNIVTFCKLGLSNFLDFELAKLKAQTSLHA